MELIYASVTLIESFILTLLQLCYLWYMITILVLKIVLILPVFYYYVTLNFFLLSTYFWLTLYFNGFSQKANFFYNQKRQRIFLRVPQKHDKSAKAFLRQL